MNGILFFTTIVVLVFGVLQIILFFKVWGMTNNVAKLRTILEEMSQNKKEKPNEIEIGSLVVDINSGKQMRVSSIKDGMYECKPIGEIKTELYRKEKIKLSL